MSASKKSAAASDELPALDLLEEAAHLLRKLPIATHAATLVGTVPFVLGALYFVSDMSGGAFAMRHAPEAALGMTLLFAWMKTWQAVAAGQALAFLEQRAPEPLSVWKIIVLGLRQFRVHAFGLLVLPLSLVLMLPFGWVYAYTQNATVLETTEGRRRHGTSVAQAKLWPMQNHTMLAIVLPFALFVFFNMAVAIYAIPTLLRSLLGIESFSANTGWTPLNTTFLTAAVGLTFLVVDPLVKCAYVLRCFYGRAQDTGVDLLVRARESIARIGGAAVLVALLFLAAGARAHAEQAAEKTNAASATAPAVSPTIVPIESTPTAVDSKSLDASLDRVLDGPEFSWRLPRETVEEDEGDRGVLARFAETVLGSIRDGARWVSRALKKIFDWIINRESPEAPAGQAGSFAGLASALHLILIVLAVLLVGVLIWFVFRWLGRGRERAPVKPAPVVAPLIERDDVTADQLPEDEWMRLARELLARGDVRLALRALFLGSLASLGARGLLVLARHKSNRDYERELARRGAQLAGVSTAFAENRRAFERAWYGHEPVGADDAKRFEEGVRRILGGAA